MAKKFKMYLAGEWVDRKEKAQVRNPYDDSLVATVAQASQDDLTEAIGKAQEAFAQTRKLTSYQREEACMAVSEGLKKNLEKFAKMMSQEVGKALNDSRVEVNRAVETFKAAAEEARRIGGEIVDLDWTRGSENRMGLVRRFPIGVISGITPFNFPLNLVAHKVAPAMASGNCIVIKPAPKTPAIALMLAELIDKTDYPKGAISVLPAANEDSAPLIEDERIKLVSFTGSDTVGWWIKERAKKARVVLELGGNAGVVVADDADLDFAVERIVKGGFGQAGQSCISVQRVFVHEDIYDAFMKKTTAKVKKLKLGDPSDDKTDIGTMVDDKAVEKTKGIFDDARENGAEFVTGGTIKGRLVEPTILTNVKNSMKACAMEAFAPLITVTPYKSFKKAVEELNNTPYGLQAGVFTNRLDDVFYAFNEVEVGGLVVNDVPTYRADHQPYGGIKDSGIGREGLRYAIEDMTEIKILSMNLK
ncbi:aldehyde dehydrogenase family protein [candidate division GN15 bacterium]|nr:aldehyde dehydrogenase family protein [candidate division GN15 bacterium]